MASTSAQAGYGLYDGAGMKLPGRPDLVDRSNLRMIIDSARMLSVGVFEQYNGRRESCSASLFVAGDAPSAPVYLLTAGHCSRGVRLETGQIVADEETPPATSFDVNGQSLPVGKLDYAASAGLDLALYETAQTAQSLAALNLRAERLETDPRAYAAVSGEEIANFGFPLELNGGFYGSSCRIESARYGTDLASRCSMIGGMSGSPDYSLRTGHLLAIDSSLMSDWNMSTSLEKLATCFDAGGAFSLQIASCALPKPCPAGQDEASCRAAFCESGNGRACEDLGTAYASGRGVPNKDTAKAVHLFEIGCTADNARSCEALGEIYGMNQGGLNETGKAPAYFEKACRLGKSHACTNLGVLYDSGLAGLAQDDARSFTLYKQGCEGRDAYGCLFLARAYVNGTAGVEPSSEKADAAYAIACEFGIKEGCSKDQD